MKKEKLSLIFDFDSTFVKVEALDELASIALAQNEKREEIVSQIKHITTLGMEGVISFPESLAQRFMLLSARKEHVVELIELLKEKVSDSIKRNQNFFKENTENIYIISGGFQEYICPVVSEFGIKQKNVLANKFIYDERGNICGFDKNKNMSQEKGKVKEVNSLGLEGDVWIIGDGYTDYQIREMGSAEKFVAFCENVRRDNIIAKADLIVANMEELIAYYNQAK